MSKYIENSMYPKNNESDLTTGGSSLHIIITRPPLLSDVESIDVMNDRLKLQVTVVHTVCVSL